MAHIKRRKNTSAPPSFWPNWKTETLAIGLIVLLTFLVYGHLWKSGFTPYSKHSDLVAQHLGMKWAAYRSVSEGHGLPLWKNDQFAGVPGLTNPQSLYANPFHLLFNLINPAAAAGPTLWLHFLVMGLGMYVWGRSLGLGIMGRLCMAVSGLLNFKLIIAGYAGWMAAIPALTICPLLLAAVTYCVRRPGIASTSAMGASGALFLVSGHPQFLYYTILLAGSYVLMHAVAEGWRRQWRTLARQMLCLAGGTVLAVGIAAPLWISFLTDRGLTTRSSASYTFFLDRHHLQARHLLTFLFPEWLGTPINGTYPKDELWEDAAYFGLIPLMLAVLGAILTRSKPLTRWLVGATAACLLLAADTPVGRFFFDWVPAYALFREPNRFLFFVSFLGIALAGIGLEELLVRWKSRGTPNGRIAVALAGATLLMVAEGAFYARRYLTLLPQSEVVPHTAYAAFFANDPETFRIAPANRWTMNYGWAGPMNLQLVTGYDSYNLRHYQRYFDMLQGGPDTTNKARVWSNFTDLFRTDMLDALNVKYLLLSDPPSLPESQFEPVAQFRDQPTFIMYGGLEQLNLWILRNRTCMPRAYWSDRVVGAADDREMIEKVERSDLHTTAVVLGQRDEQSPQAKSPEDRVEVLAARAGDLKLRASCAHRRYLVAGEVWHPGWSATVDGRPAAVHRTNIAMMGMWVEPGLHEIELTFRPIYWGLSLALSGLSGALLAILLATAVWRGGYFHIRPAA
jgi:hypothetical protein